MISRYIVILLIGAGITLAGCRREETSPRGSELDSPKLTDVDPEAERPRMIFPVDQRTGDATLNAFVSQAMQICSEGDYDGFRKLFGTAQAPPDNRRFARVWGAVREISVQEVIEGRQDPRDYYAWVVVHYREPDRDDRMRREVLIHVYKEGDDWRLGAPSKDARDRILAERGKQDADVSDITDGAGSSENPGI